jgi:hypothetical protein
MANDPMISKQMRHSGCVAD